MQLAGTEISHSNACASVTYVPPTGWRQVLQRYDLRAPFILHYGPDAPTRNTRRLIEAWALTDKFVRQTVQLAIIGVGPGSGDELVNVVNRLGLAQSIRLYRALGDPRDLSALLSAADVAALPVTQCDSMQPIFDAWATKAAVLTSDLPAVAEHAGDAAVLVDPNDAGAIARGINRLVRDARFRRQLIERGQRRLAGFTAPVAA